MEPLWSPAVATDGNGRKSLGGSEREGVQPRITDEFCCLG
jgi:hypothetical protein